jgi:hypothetical protein
MSRFATAALAVIMLVGCATRGANYVPLVNMNTP